MTIQIKAFFILGGPGTGKGTNCERLVRDFGFSHYSAGDLLRAASKADTDLGRKVAEILALGQIVPSEVTIALIRDAITNDPNPAGYLVDGFPRKFDQAQMFEDDIARARGILFFDCPMDVMEARLLSRVAAGSDRSDDKPEVIRRRLETNQEQCVPIVEMYKKEGRCTTIDSNRPVDEVYAEVKQMFIDKFECVPKA